MRGGQGLLYTDLFDAEMIARMAEHFQTLLKGIVANPGTFSLSGLPLSYPELTLGTCPILLPHLYEQQAIATVLSDLDTEIAALETRLAKTQAIKQGMMQELLAGRIRLKIEE